MTALRARLASIVADHTGWPAASIADETHFCDEMGFDNLDLIDMQIDIETRLDIGRAAGDGVMIHIRKDDGGAPNSERRMLCGIGPELPEGDKFFFEAEVGSHYRVDCLGCNPGGPRQLGTPISQLSGRPGHPGFDEFCRIARSWGYD